MAGNQGFASMDQNRQREIARKGGESVPNEKRSFSRDPKLAAEAGRKGGQSVAPENRSFSRNRELARAAGRKGGERSGAMRAKQGTDVMSGNGAETDAEMTRNH